MLAIHKTILPFLWLMVGWQHWVKSCSPFEVLCFPLQPTKILLCVKLDKGITKEIYGYKNICILEKALVDAGLATRL